MTQGRPTAASAIWPYKHDSMAVVMREEARQCSVFVHKRNRLIASDSGHSCCATFQKQVAV